MSADTLDDFQAWLEDRDLLAAAKVTGKRVEGFGVCLAAKEALQPGDQLLAVPRRLHLTAKQAEGTALGDALEALGVVDESVVLAMVLLEQMALGEASPWARYIQLLPTADELTLPLLWPATERAELLEGSHLLGCVDSLVGDLAQQWAAIDAAVVKPNPEHFPASVFRFEGLAWATAIVLSRALPFADSLALIPFLDLANHDSGSRNACSIRVSAADGEQQSEGWQPDDLTGESAAVLTAGTEHEAGEQVFIDYAGEGNWRSSWEMLYTYGIVPGAAPQEWLEAGGRPLLLAGVRRDDPLHEQKVAALVALGAAEEGAYEQWVDIKADPAETASMAPLLRLAHLGREADGKAGGEAEGEAEGNPQARLQAKMTQWQATPADVWGAVQQPLSAANERAVAGQVVGECEAALAALPSPETIAERLASSEVRKVLAGRVLAGERHALEACRTHWQKVLGDMA